MYQKEPLLHKNLKTSPIIQNTTPRTQVSRLKLALSHWIKSDFLAKQLTFVEKKAKYIKILQESSVGYGNRVYILSRGCLWGKIAKLIPKEEHWRLTWKYSSWERQTKGDETWNTSPFGHPLPLPSCFEYRWNLIIIRQGSGTIEMQMSHPVPLGSSGQNKWRRGCPRERTLLADHINSHAWSFFSPPSAYSYHLD